MNFEIIYSFCPFTDGRVSCDMLQQYKGNSVYNMTVLAQDLGTPPQTNHVTLIVMVVNDDEHNTPHFGKQFYEGKLKSDSVINTKVLSISAGSANFNYTITGIYHVQILNIYVSFCDEI